MAPRNVLLGTIVGYLVATAVVASASGSALMFRTPNDTFVVSIALQPGVCNDQHLDAHVQVVFDGKFVDEICVFSCSSPLSECKAVASRYEGEADPLKATAYVVLKDGTTVVAAHRVSDVVAGTASMFDSFTSMPSSSPIPASSSLHVGVLYEGWHTFAATAMATIAARGGVQLTVEDVIRSNGNYQMSQILDKYNERFVPCGRTLLGWIGYLLWLVMNAMSIPQGGCRQLLLSSRARPWILLYLHQTCK
jgi:hypothetical protein